MTDPHADAKHPGGGLRPAGGVLVGAGLGGRADVAGRARSGAGHDQPPAARRRPPPWPPRCRRASSASAGTGLLDTTRLAAGEPGTLDADLLAEPPATCWRRWSGSSEQLAALHARHAVGRRQADSWNELLTLGKEEPRCFGKLTSIRRRPARPDRQPGGRRRRRPGPGRRPGGRSAARGYLIQGDLTGPGRPDRRRAAGRRRGRADRGGPGGRRACSAGRREGCDRLIHVLPKPGVMDPVAQSALAAIADFGIRADAVRTLKKYWIGGLTDGQLELLALEGPGQRRHRAGDRRPADVRAPRGRLALRVQAASPCRSARWTTTALGRLSLEGQLYLSLAEMQTIRAHFRVARPRPDRRRAGDARPDLERALQPQDAGRPDPLSRRARASGSSRTCSRRRSSPPRSEIRRQLGADDWCVSVFEDNAGVIRFDDQLQRLLQGRDAQPPLGPGALRRGQHGHRRRDPRPDGHRPGRQADLPTPTSSASPRPTRRPDGCRPGVLHPRRVMKGVVAGVRDYGNRMGIPTVNGAVYFDARYLGNPLVYCGNVGLMPRDKSLKQPQPGDLIVAVGGRTGRDGIHGATFSSAELTSQSETALRRRRADRQRHHREEGARRAAGRPRPRALQRHHRLRRRRVLQRRRRDGREDRRRGLARPRAAEVRGPVLHRDLDLRGPGADGPGRAATSVGTSFASSAQSRASRPR